MNDEIKEIKLDHFKDLEELKQNVENWIKIDEEYWERWFGLSDLSNLLDYITNLQNENDILNDITESYEETSKEEQEEMEKLQQRIDKAIEFIKENSGYDEEISSCCDDLLYSDCDNLIALLGGDEE